MALSPDEKFIYVNPDTTIGEYNLAQYFPVKHIRGLECANAANFYVYFRGPKDATSTRLTVSLTSGFIKEFFTQFVDEINFGEKSVITLADRNIAVDATTGGTDFVHVNAFVSPVINSDALTAGYEDLQIAEDLNVGGTITGNLTGDVTGTASIATTVTVADESTDTTCFPLFATTTTGNLAPKSGSNLTFNSSSGLLTATLLAGDVATVASLVCTEDATFGGGYGSTGATISTTGSIQTDSTLSSSGLIVAGSAAYGGYARFYEGTNNGTNYMALRAPSVVTTSATLYLPDGDGSANQVLKTDGAGNLSWTDMSGGGSTQKVYFNGGVNLQYPYNRFLPIGSYYVVEQTTDDNPEFTTFVAPYDGKLIKTMLRSEEALGNTSLTWYKVGDGTEEPDQGSTVDTKTVDIASAATTYTYTYDADATFSKGDAMSVAIDPTTDPVGAGVSYTIVMEFDEST